MLKGTDDFFAGLEEPVRSCLLALRSIILKTDENITETMRYGMPFYFYKGKRFAYLWIQKKSGLPYIGIVDGKKVHHPLLLAEKRARMKILLLDPFADLPLPLIHHIIGSALAGKQSG